MRLWARAACAALPLVSLPASARQAPLPQAATAQIVNVMKFGARGDGQTDDTAALQGILDNGRGPVVLYLPGTNACYRISRALIVPNESVNGYAAKRPVYFIGDGPEHTELLQTGRSADGIDLSFGSKPPANGGLWSGGGVTGMTIAAGPSCLGPGLNPLTDHSSGAAISIQNGNNAVTVDNVLWKGFRIGLNLDQTWQGSFTRLWGYGQAIGIRIGCNTAFGQGAGNNFSHVLLSNGGFDPAIAASAIGFKLCAGGQYLDPSVELDGFYNGLLVQPASGQIVEGLSLDGVIADTSLSHGIVLDGTGGTIGAVRMTNSWAGFNNGAGLVIKGRTGNVQGVTIVGSHFRENGLAGIEDGIAAELLVTGSDVTGNGRGMFALAGAGTGCRAGDVLTVRGGGQPPGSSATTVTINRVDTSGAVLTNGFTVNAAGFYSRYPASPARVTGGRCAVEPTFALTRPRRYNPGIHIAANVGSWSIVGNFFGNFATSSRSQAADIVIDHGLSSNATYRANTTTAPAPNSGVPDVINGSAAHINWDEELHGFSGRSGISSGRAVYLGPRGAVAEGGPGFLMGGGTLTEIACSASRPPGRGRTYRFQPYKTGTGAVGTAAQITNGGSRTGVMPESVSLPDGSNLLIRLVISRAAALSAFSCRLGVAD